MKIHARAAKRRWPVAIDVLGIAAAVGTFLLLNIGTAHATMSTIGDPNDDSSATYAEELDLTGLSATPYLADNLAHTICEERMDGQTEDQLVVELEAPPHPWTPEQSVEALMGGEYHFCHTELKNDPLHGCPNCGHGGEPGAMVRPDRHDYVGWHALRCLDTQNFRGRL